MLNERYYQFIIWRAILPVWHAVTEREENRDLIVTCDDVKHYFEMKRCFDAAGNKNLPGMRQDILRLQNHNNGYLLVISTNPPDLTSANFDYIKQALPGIDSDARQDYRFLTHNTHKETIEFWFAGWPVTRSASQNILS